MKHLEHDDDDEEEEDQCFHVNVSADQTAGGHVTPSWHLTPLQMSQWCHHDVITEHHHHHLTSSDFICLCSCFKEKQTQTQFPLLFPICCFQHYWYIRSIIILIQITVKRWTLNKQQTNISRTSEPQTQLIDRSIWLIWLVYSFLRIRLIVVVWSQSFTMTFVLKGHQLINISYLYSHFHSMFELIIRCVCVSSSCVSLLHKWFEIKSLTDWLIDWLIDWLVASYVTAH